MARESVARPRCSGVFVTCRKRKKYRPSALKRKVIEGRSLKSATTHLPNWMILEVVTLSFSGRSSATLAGASGWKVASATPTVNASVSYRPEFINSK